MPRFTPWSPGAPLDPSESGRLLYEVLRPSLHHAFPLPESRLDRPFRHLLEALAQRENGRAPEHGLRPGP